MSLRVDLRSRWPEFLDVQCWSGIIIVHSLYIMVVNGGLSQCCFNGPTSRNVAGIYWLSEVYCNLLFWVYTLPPVFGSWAVSHRSAGTQHLVSKPSVSLPPPKDFALSEPLPGGVQGWIWVVSDI